MPSWRECPLRLCLVRILSSCRFMQKCRPTIDCILRWTLSHCSSLFLCQNATRGHKTENIVYITRCGNDFVIKGHAGWRCLNNWFFSLRSLMPRRRGLRSIMSTSSASTVTHPALSATHWRSHKTPLDSLCADRRTKKPCECWLSVCSMFMCWIKTWL